MSTIWLSETSVPDTKAFRTRREASEKARDNRKRGFTTWIFKATIDPSLSKQSLIIALINNPRAAITSKELVRTVPGLKHPRA